MPTVLITGFNGFVAVHTALQFLSEGWNVRGTVRSAAKGDKTVALPVFEQYKGKVDYAVVEDLVEGDYTEALKGVDAIAHCASPWHLKGESWAEYRDPAVKGTTNIIQQAAKIDSIKAVGVVSSFAAILDCLKPYYEQSNKVYTEADWLPYSEEDCEKMDPKDGRAPTLWYCASKKYAEIAAVDAWKAAGKPFSLSTLNPPMILGPAYHYGSAEGLAESDVSTSSLYAALVTGKDNKVPPTAFTAWVDVRDVAKAFYVTITKHISGRFALSAKSLFDYDTIAAVGTKVRPDLEEKGVIPQHETENTPMSKGSYKLDASKAEKELEIQFHTLDKMVKDTLDQFEKLGATKA